jgi:hypothetical protein
MLKLCEKHTTFKRKCTCNNLRHESTGTSFQTNLNPTLHHAELAERWFDSFVLPLVSSADLSWNLKTVSNPSHEQLAFELFLQMSWASAWVVQGLCNHHKKQIYAHAEKEWPWDKLVPVPSIFANTSSSCFSDLTLNLEGMQAWASLATIIGKIAAIRIDGREQL